MQCFFFNLKLIATQNQANMNSFRVLLFLILATLSVAAQTKKGDTIQDKKELKFDYKALIIPTLLISYGIIGKDHEDLLDFDTSFNHGVNNNHLRKFPIDEATQSLAIASVYGLNLIGIKGKNNFKDRTIIIATAGILVGATSLALKRSIDRQRPNGSGLSSFPSGHTATAFMGAEFLYQEYKDVSIWYGISGYAVAAGTGYLRMYNRKHWLTDVVAGAGIGILSTKIAYWTHPFLKQLFIKKEKSLSGSIAPYYNGEQYGLGMLMSF